ncbi:uncharacterized protein PHA67_015830 isoform 2-T2 [Liasis olivaceus]
MDRSFFPHRQRFPRSRGGHWFHQNNIPNENFWMGNNWDMPQNQFPQRPPPRWNQCHPEQERPYNISFDNCIRGSYHRRPYRGPSYTRSKKTSQGRGHFQKPSSSSCLISVMPKKKSEKVEKQPEDSKKIKQDKGNTATSGKEGVQSKVKPKDSQPAEESPSQPVSVASPGAAAAEEVPSGITEVLSQTKIEDIVPDKLKDCEATEDHLNQADPILSPGVSTEDKTSSCSVEVLHNTEKENSVLLQTSHVCSPTTVEIPFLSTVEIPFLLENASDDQSEKKGEIKLTETSAKQDDTDHCQTCVAPAVDSSSLPSTLDDIRCVPVLVREKDNELTETSAKQDDTDHCQTCVAPAVDSSSLPSTLDDIRCVPVLVREKDNELTETTAKQNDTDHCQACVAPALDSSSLPSTLDDIRCVPVLVREKDNELPYSWEATPFHAENQRGWAPEDYQEPPWNVNQADQCHKVSECYRGLMSSSVSSNEKHNDGRLVEYKSSSPKSHHSSSSKHCSTKQTSSDLHSQSPRSHGRQEYSSRSSHKRERSTERQERSSKLSCRREHSSRSSHRQENSPKREKHTSKSPCRWKENKLARGCCCHCRCYCQQSCSPSRESPWQRCSPPPYLTCKIKCLHVSKEISKVYRIPHHHSPERSIVNEKKITENRQLVEPKIIEKKKKATSGNGRKALKSATRKEKASSPCQLNTEEETRRSPSWTSKDLSAAVLARKEEIEQAYLQVLLNFGAIAIMLVEKEPCMTEAMHSALRANLRKIGGYYECLLKNYIDSLTEAS